MKQTTKWITIAIAALSITACRKDIKPATSADEEILQEESSETARRGHHGNGSAGHVYTLTNQSNTNKVIVYRRGSDGELDFLTAYPTGGKGTGAGLGSQGAVILTEDNSMLLAVNAGSNTISCFKIHGNQLYLASTVSSHGTMPISITQHDRIVYVLNAGGNGNISGFKLSGNGKLTPIPYSTKPLSSSMSGPAQISFVNEGKVLVITEKATNKIITYTVNYYGIPGAFHSITSAAPTPFGFAVRGYNNIIVSEAAGGAPGISALSSYWIRNNGEISLIEGPVSAGQTAACWVVVTDNGKFTYATNTGSNNVSSFQSSHSGGLDVLNAIAAPSGTAPIDADLSKNSSFLYVLNSGSNNISVYKVKNNGGLNCIQTIGGLPSGSVGIAAR